MMKRYFALGMLLLGALATAAAAATQNDLDSAAKHGKVAFIVVMDKDAGGMDQAMDMAKQAAKQVKKSTVVKLDRSDPSNADLVAKYRLAGAPVPIILVAGRNGVIAGGLVVAQATTDKIVAMVPSPKKAEVLMHLQSGKAVLVSASRKGMAKQGDCSAACAAACGQLQDRCMTVAIDMDDPAEAEFLKSIKVNTASAEPVILVVNAQGQITGSYDGAVDVAALVQAATKKAGGCCPSTVQNPNASCAPPKK